MARVMIVEDEPITAADLEQKLTALGHLITDSVDTGEDAVTHAAHQSPDLVLMDIRLRGAMTGIDAAQQIRAHSDVPVVFLTAFADQDTVDRACAAQPFGYLVKPFTERAVATAVQVALTRSRTERAHLERERWMEAGLRGADEALIAVDERATLRFLNEPAERLLGVKASDMIGTDARALVRFEPDDAGDATHPLDAALRDGRVTSAPRRDVRVRGGEAPVNVAYSAAPVLNDGADSVGAVLLLHATAARDTGADHEVGALSMRLSHEINNPLTYNLGALSLALRELDQLRAMSALTGPAADTTQLQSQLVRVESLLRDAQEGATRIACVVGELAALAPGDKGLSPLHPVELLELAIGLSGIQASPRLHIAQQQDPAPVIRGNKWELSRALAGAMQHALEALDLDGKDASGAATLTLGVGTDARGWAELRVLSRGQRRVDTQATDAARASLAAIEQTVARRGGELDVCEQRDGRAVTLRIAPPAATPTAARREASLAASGRGSVLVVDDEPMISRVLGISLAREHDVKLASSARDALALLERGETFDVILCDVSMPGMDGRELYEHLNAKSPELASRMLFMSGGATTERNARFLDAMADRRIDKPFRMEQLLRVLRERMDARGMHATP